MLQIDKLSVYYKSKREKVKALGPINFEVNRDDICAIIGPSGCGKTTLLNVLAGISKEYEGEVLIDSKKLSPHIHKIGYIPQNFGLLPWKNVKDNCLLPFKIRGEKVTAKDLKKLDSFLEKLNISNLLYRYPNELSGGQKQRVSIVKNLMMSPDLLLMDEAFSALDAIIRDEAQELFLKLWSENKMTTFFVTHSIDEALYMGKKIIVLSNTPGLILEIIDNKLFNMKNYKESKEYSELFLYIKELIKRGWEN